MSWIVECRGQSIWEPASVVGRLFLGELAALERLLGCPSGIAQTAPDEMAIDQVQLERFVQRGFEVLDRTNSGPLLALVGGCLAVAIALNAKMTGSWLMAPADFSHIVERASENGTPPCPSDTYAIGRGSVVGRHLHSRSAHRVLMSMQTDDLGSR